MERVDAVPDLGMSGTQDLNFANDVMALDCPITKAQDLRTGISRMPGQQLDRHRLAVAPHDLEKLIVAMSSPPPHHARAKPAVRAADPRTAMKIATVYMMTSVVRLD